MAIKKSTPIKADPTITADHYQILEVNISVARKVGAVTYGLYKSAEKKADGCSIFESRVVRFEPNNFPFSDGILSNQIIDQASINLDSFFQGAEFVADV